MALSRKNPEPSILQEDPPAHPATLSPHPPAMQTREDTSLLPNGAPATQLPTKKPAPRKRRTTRSTTSAHSVAATPAFTATGAPQPRDAGPDLSLSPQPAPSGPSSLVPPSKGSSPRLPLLPDTPTIPSVSARVSAPLSTHPTKNASRQPSSRSQASDPAPPTPQPSTQAVAPPPQPPAAEPSAPFASSPAPLPSAAPPVTPLEIFTRVMQGDETITDRQFDAAKVAAPYLHPKLAGLSMNAVVRKGLEDFTDDELSALAQAGQSERTG